MDKIIKICIALWVLLIAVSLITPYFGLIDTGDYIAPAKYFSGDYSAKLRTSHSTLYGFLESPILFLFPNLFSLKVLSFFYLSLLIFSIYKITKSKKALLFFMCSPIIWYIGPWINSIQLASLLFLWSFFFILKFEKKQEYRYLIYSGVLAALSSSIWNSVLFLSVFLVICFLVNRNINYFFIFCVSFFMGLCPLFLFDLYYYNFPLYTLIKFVFGTITTLLYGSIYSGVNQITNSLLEYLSFLLIVPFTISFIFKKAFFKEHKKEVIFLILCFGLFLVNPQVRYLLLPISLVSLFIPKILSKRIFYYQIMVFSFLSLIIVNLYLFQIGGSTNIQDFDSLIKNGGKIRIYNYSYAEVLTEDINNLTAEYPNLSFIVGNEPDSYQVLAINYWGKQVNEFVSIQDYALWLDNETSLFEKKIILSPRIPERRQIWLAGGISKNQNDLTNYSLLNLGIGIGEPINISGFKQIKKYDILYLSKKE